ncbi:MAG: hypothetical protein EOP84_21180 [Verrucomicrobiaceae bacterium]|nr:MAG: hypothetical protein EOP84_21180 [Verrucomicrobiaceae bacterium]
MFESKWHFPEGSIPTAYVFVTPEASRNLINWFNTPNILTVTYGPTPATKITATINNAAGTIGETDKGFIRFRTVIP